MIIPQRGSDILREIQGEKYNLGELAKFQPRSQGLSLPAPKSERRETLVGSGHVPPRIWVVTKNSLKGGAALTAFVNTKPTGERKVLPPK